MTNEELLARNDGVKCPRCQALAIRKDPNGAKICQSCYTIVSDLDMDMATMAPIAPETPNELWDRHKTRVRRQAADSLLRWMDRVVGPDSAKIVVDPKDVEIARLSAEVARLKNEGKT